MSTNKTIQHKRGTPSNWAKATNYIPPDGELIIYRDPKDPGNETQIKIGNGNDNVNELEFVTMTPKQIDKKIQDKIDALEIPEASGGLTTEEVQGLIDTALDALEIPDLNEDAVNDLIEAALTTARNDLETTADTLVGAINELAGRSASETTVATDETVTLSADIWTDKTIGHISGTTSKPQKIASAGDNLKTMFTNIFGEITDDATNLVNNPSITSVSIGSSSYEYGTQLNSVSVTITPNAGWYKYGPDVQGAAWNGNYTLSGTGFTTKNNSTADTQTVNLSSTFTVGTSSALTLNVSREYNAATNTADTKLGVGTNQAIVAGTATATGTFNPTASYYQYYGFTEGEGITAPNSGNTRLNSASVTYTPSTMGRLWFFDKDSNSKVIKQYLDGQWLSITTGKINTQVSITLSTGVQVLYYAYYTDKLASGKTGEYALL